MSTSTGKPLDPGRERSTLSVAAPGDFPLPRPERLPALARIDDLWSRGIKVPVGTLDDLARLDAEEIRLGYMDGRGDGPEPGHNRSRSYWHGWRNGAADGRHRDADAAQAELARRAYWWAMRDTWGAAVPDRYRDLEMRHQRGEPV